MLVAILHNAVAEDAPADEWDVLVQVEAVAGALQRLGHEPVAVPVTLNLADFQRRLIELRPEVAFNLVEALGGTDRLCPAVPVLLETAGVPFTGSGADALYVTSSKRLTKQRLGDMNIPTPASITFRGDKPQLEGGTEDGAFPGYYLLKAVHEHASFGMDDEAVFDAARISDVVEMIRRQSARYGKPFFAERFIEGREFNLSVLGSGGESVVLPPAEITFDAFPPDKPRIVGYAAKWDEGSFEYNETPRRFEFPPEDDVLLDLLRGLAARTWHVLNLNGYARVDFRVDEIGRPWVIEANANPCLSPDAGFAAALDHAGIGFDEAIRRVLAAVITL